MSTMINNIKDNEHGYDQRIHCKGDAQRLLSMCTNYLDESGDPQPLTSEMREDLMKNVIEDFAQNAMRTIFCAYKDLKPDEGGKDHDEDASDGVSKAVEESLTCICILDLADPPRPGVEDTVYQLQKEGINVRMIASDDKVGSKIIAEKVGIISKDQENSEEAIMTGSEFIQRICDGGIEETDLKEFAKIKDSLKVIARSSPEDKYNLVIALQKMGEVVAVIGDGTNDAPALKKADVGFAMCIIGTDVAKEASDMIMLDDNVRSVMMARFWANSMPENIKRFIQVQLTLNLSILVILFLGSIFLREQPLKPIHLLWVTFIIDFLSIIAQMKDKIINKLSYFCRKI